MTRVPSTHALWRGLTAISFAGVLGLQVGVDAEPNSAGGESRARRVDVASAEQEKTLKDINKQLDEILEVQAAILQRYDELMQELQAVKVRASR